MANPSGARFKLTQGAHVSLSSEAGFTAVSGTTLSMQLEASPALDVRSCVYEILLPTKSAPALTLSSSGIASPPTAAITMSMPSGIYSFVLRCTTNNGEPVTTALGKQDFSINTFERVVSIPNSLGHRKIIVGETLEFASPRGWTDAFNDLVDAEELGVQPVGADVSIGYPDGIPGVFKIANVDGGGDAIVIDNVDQSILTSYSLTMGGTITMTEVSAGVVPTPPSTTQTLFIDSADHKLKRKNSSGTVTIIG